MVFLREFIQIKRFAPAKYLGFVPEVLLGSWTIVDGLLANSGERLTFDSIGSSYGERTPLWPSDMDKRCGFPSVAGNYAEFFRLPLIASFVGVVYTVSIYYGQPASPTLTSQ